MSGHHMTPDEFRQYGKQVIDWIADYYKWVETYPVLSRVEPGEIRSRLPDGPPRKGERFSDILDDVDTIIMPGITHWQSPNFHAFFPCNSSGPAIIGELLSAGLGVQGMLWATSPACTELETHVLDWVADMLALPDRFKSTSEGGGVIQDSASSASLCAVLAARERATNGRSNTEGCDRTLVAYTSSHAHSSIEKAIRIAGLGSDNLRLIKVDETYAMQAGQLARQVAEDRAAGMLPFFVSATVGTTSSNAMDPVREIGQVCGENGLWLHVDAAMSGTAAICPEFRWIHEGLELADSYCFNPHKWMFTNFDCDCFYVADRSALVGALSVLPEYLRNKASDDGAVIDYRDWQVPLGRRFRSLKLWFVIRHYGVEGLQYHIREHVKLTQELASWITDDPDFEIAAPHPLNLVCFSHRKGDDFTKALLERVNAGGKAYLSHTTLDGRYVIRLCVGQTDTQRQHVKAVWKLIRSTAESIAE